MRTRLAVTPAVFVAALAFTSPASAGSIDLLSNQSASFIRSFSRNASIDGADIVAYNPGGTPWLKPGLYLNLSSQTILKDYKITFRGDEYGANDPTPVLPAFFAVWRPKDLDLAAFVAFTVPAGGGSLTYKKGVPFLEPLQSLVDGGTAGPTNGTFSGSSMFLAPTIGAAYRFADIVGVSAALRVVIANKTFTGSATYGDVEAGLDATKSAVGVGGIFGLQVAPIPEVRLGLRFETETGLEFKTKSTLTNLKAADNNALWSFMDGAKEQRNLPMTLAAGVAVDVIPELTLGTSFMYYMTKSADAYKDVDGVFGYVKGYDDDYDNGFDLAFGVDVRPIPELTLSAGYNRSVSGANKDTMSDFEYALNSNSVALGGKWWFISNVALTLGFSATFYEEGKNDAIHPAYASLPAEQRVETFNKTVFDLAIGAEWKVF